MDEDELPPPAPLQAAIADAVHRAVANFVGGDGYGHCFLYAVAGWSLAREVLGRDYLLQAGSLRLLARPPNGWLVINCGPGGLDRGAYHCWFARAGPGDGIAELVDLSSRHYRRWADSNLQAAPGQPPVKWDWPAGPPEFVWQAAAHSSWVGLVADEALTRDLIRRAGHPGLDGLHRLSLRHFRGDREPSKGGPGRP